MVDLPSGRSTIRIDDPERVMASVFHSLGVLRVLRSLVNYRHLDLRHVLTGVIGQIGRR